MFCDSPVEYPANNLVLGRYLVPARDLGPAMTDKMLKANGEVVLQSTLHDLMLEEIENPAHIELMRKFTESCETVLGPKAISGDFTPDKVTPEWELYKDDDEQEGTADAPPEYIKPTPEANNNYVNVNIMFPRGSKISRGRVTGCKREIDDNTYGRALDNPILDMWEYTIHFNYR